jgi:Flp pilus assembly protein TadG
MLQARPTIATPGRAEDHSIRSDPKKSIQALLNRSAQASNSWICPREPIGVSILPALFIRATRSDSGAAALEFAILAPVFLLFATGMLAYGIYFGAAHSLQQLAADAARTSIAGLTDSERASLVATFLDDNAAGYPPLDPQALNSEVGPEPGDADEYRVTLSYNASNLPIWDLYPPLPLPSRTITYSSVIRLGGL